VRPPGFKTRLWLGHVAVLALMLAVAALAADWMLRRVVLGHIIDDAILALAESEAAALQSDPAAAIHVHEPAPGGPPSFVRLDKFVQVIDLDGKVVARSATLGTVRLPVGPTLLDRLRDGETAFVTVTDVGPEPVRMVTLPVSVGPHRYGVQVGMSLDDAYAVLRVGRWLVLSISVVMLAGIGLTGALLARKALGPIDAIVRRARRIGESNLAERLPHPGTRDEIARLVETLNDMLGRLDRSFDAQRRFTADASHELRSPLSRLRAELEVTLRRSRTPREYEETLRSCLDEVERLQALTEELLALARLDASEESERAEALPIGDLVDAAIAAVAPEAKSRGVTVEVAPSSEIVVQVAPVAAKVALANVLHNAVKFSPAGGLVKTVVDVDRDEAVVTVSDSGPGVAAEEVPRIFERFYRGAASRTSETAGIGLGLAIARALIERQGGRISVAVSDEQGATFRIHLPRGEQAT
jgi:two-component system, OmpR family, sensor kinase